MTFQNRKTASIINKADKTYYIQDGYIFILLYLQTAKYNLLYFRPVGIAHHCIAHRI